MKAYVVIGANFGDEGKGLMTDYFAHKHSANYVVRFNGGAQAGHTVVTPEGLRHTHSHFGSGTLRGVPTILSEHFILNPILFNKELSDLQILLGDKIPRVFVNEQSQVTTPWDIIANQTIEASRGVSRHGSCGAGINETINRSKVIPCQYRDLKGITMSRFSDKMMEISSYYKNYFVRKEISVPEETLSFFDSTAIVDKFYQDWKVFSRNTSLFCREQFHPEDVLVFEGAQGLGLDEFMGHFPFVTRSNCGLRNVIDLQRSWGFDIEEVCYVTRSYLTRHGNGPMDSHVEGMVFDDFTNIPNPHQGTLRFGHLDLESMFQRIRTDKASVNLDEDAIMTTIAVTHVDQRSMPVVYSSTAIGYDYVSGGPTRNDVRELD